MLIHILGIGHMYTVGYISGFFMTVYQKRLSRSALILPEYAVDSHLVLILDCTIVHSNVSYKPTDKKLRN